MFGIHFRVKFMYTFCTSCEVELHLLRYLPDCFSKRQSSTSFESIL